MIREIVKDPLFLSLRSQDATKSDAAIAEDLEETLSFHRDECVGMAANMIGERKRIICVSLGFGILTMYNPAIIRKYGRYEAEEGCLSLAGKKKCIRWKEIDVQFQDKDFSQKVQHFSGFTAQIIQHEIDHCSGILI